MSLTMIQDVIKHSPSKGNARLVELVMAEAVNEKRVQLGHSPAVWLSQSTMARRCNCSRSTVERGLDDLKGLGRIFDTGERMTGRYRGTVVYHMAQPRPDDLTDSDVTQDRSGVADLTDSAPDLTHPGVDLTHSAQRPASTLKHKPGVEPEAETDARPPAHEGAAEEIVYPDGEADAVIVAAQRDSTPTRDYIASLPSHVQPQTPQQIEAERREKESELAQCEPLIAEGRAGSLTIAAAAELREELGLTTGEVAA